MMEELEPSAVTLRRDVTWTKPALELGSALEKLTSEQRAVLHLTIVEKLSMVEAASRINLSPRTAQRRRKAALQRLRKLLAHFTEEPGLNRVRRLRLPDFRHPASSEA
jgi:DNA-directed RNA polymerase specialized sigma24 family protein